MPTTPEIFQSLDYGPAFESDSAAQAWLEGHNRTFGHFIDGAWTEPRADFDTFNPAREVPLASITQGVQADVDAAVRGARRAQRGWAALSGAVRARHLYALARQVQKHSRLLAVLESLDTGKPIREARDIDIPLVARHFYYHAGMAALMAEEMPGRAPLGVCGQIVPWNFPLLMLAWKVAPALAMGNTVVLKPAEWTPLTALKFAELAQEAGLPRGVLNIVTGDGETGRALVAHPGIDKVAFTGSTAVGREIARTLAGSGKALTLELGGKSPYIVFEDADLDSAIEGLVDAIWFNGGQVCCAGARLLVQEGIAEDFHARLIARMERLRLGDPLDKCVDVGALVHPEHLARVRALVAQTAGCVHTSPCPLPKGGTFMAPQLITGLSPADPLMQDEIFGPVLVSTTFRTPAEAVALANDSRYGLAASLWTENVNRALDLAPKLEAGVIWINATNLFDAAAPFGGMKESGFGREGGWQGLRAYTKPTAPTKPLKAPRPFTGRAPGAADPIDRTPKMLIGGKQTRADGGTSLHVFGPKGRCLGAVPEAGRKDIRNAVEAANAATGWSGTTGHARAQILYYLAENLAARADTFAARISAQTGRDGAPEVAASLERLFTWAAWADKHEGRATGVPLRGVALAMPAPLGVIGAFCPAEAPLLGAVSILGAALAMGNRLVLVAPETAPLTLTDLIQVIDTSDVPGGVANILTGHHAALAPHLAGHMGVQGVWAFGDAALSTTVEREAAATLRRSWVNHGHAFDWKSPQTDRFRQAATETRTLWIPYGD